MSCLNGVRHEVQLRIGKLANEHSIISISFQNMETIVHLQILPNIYWDFHLILFTIITYALYIFGHQTILGQLLMDF